MRSKKDILEKAEEGDLDSQLEAASFFTFDSLERVNWLEKAAGHNCPRTFFLLATSLERIKERKHEALSWYIKSASMGYLHSQTALAHYFETENNPLNLPLDLAKSRYWHEKAAENGDPDVIRDVARFFLGLKIKLTPFEEYELTDIDLNNIRSPQKAFEYLKIAEQKTQNKSHYKQLGLLLGFCFLKGIGTEIDLKKAFDNFLLAATCGSFIAAKEVSNCFLKGIGVEADSSKAAIWGNKAASILNLDHKRADSFLKQIFDE